MLSEPLSRRLVLTDRLRVRVELERLGRPAAGTVRIAVRDCGVCGSDLLRYRTTTAAHRNWGHEAVGTVVALGAGVSPDWRGASVALHTSVACAACSHCRAGRQENCTRWEYREVGGFADLTDVPVTHVERLPAPLTDVDVLLEPLHVALDLVARAAVEPGESVLLFGIGPIALLTLRCLRLRGLGPVRAVHRGHRRACAALASAWGAEICTARTAPPSRVAIVTAPYAAIPEAAQVVERGGRIVYNGLSEPSVTPLDLRTLQVGQKSLVPSFPHPQESFCAAYDILHGSPEEFGRIISHRFDLSEADRGFALLERDVSDAVKVVLGDYGKRRLRRP
ncbi:alcohol dehydrogenase catalytic domain-containing protein [Streptomyces sp. NPDC051913]|uniref:alcohol dehydrogenase catalytic domain-containing protein n=1 Tax=Streptomyces sp. NPDC051913 TaxID=3365676 RepID=UPI0037D2502A